MSKTTPRPIRPIVLGCALATAFITPSTSTARDKTPAGAGGTRSGTPLETTLDLPGDANRYFGQRPDLYRDSTRKIAKIDLDADFSYDGIIDNNDPADGGAFEITPPGLVVGVGEMTQLVLRVRPYRLDYSGQAVVSLSVRGINRGEKSGEYPNIETERTSMGHIKVWADKKKTIPLLDSNNPSMREHHWTIADNRYPPNTPGNVPRVVWVEGISSSKLYSGDVRLLLKAFHRKDAPPPTAPGEKKKKRLFNRFKTAYDHILLTVTEQPQRKEIINPGASVWSSK